MISERLSDSISKLYTVFERYKLEDFENVTCFDFGPTETELEGMRVPLRKVPFEVLAAMEFYEHRWDGWGREIDVKYFLPRFCEFIASNTSELEDSGGFSFFKYKLGKCLHPENGRWTDDERFAIRSFIRELLLTNFAARTDIRGFVECAVAVGFPAAELCEIWRINDQINCEQLLALLSELGYRDAKSKSQAQLTEFIDAGVFEFLYIDEVSGLQEFLRLASDHCSGKNLGTRSA